MPLQKQHSEARHPELASRCCQHCETESLEMQFLTTASCSLVHTVKPQAIVCDEKQNNNTMKLCHLPCPPIRSNSSGAKQQHAAKDWIPLQQHHLLLLRHQLPLMSQNTIPNAGYIRCMHCKLAHRLSSNPCIEQCADSASIS
jgi:hypothetical protein